MTVLISVLWDALPRLKLLDGQGDGSANSGFVAKLRFLNAHIVGGEHTDAFTNAATNRFQQEFTHFCDPAGDDDHIGMQRGHDVRRSDFGVEPQRPDSRSIKSPILCRTAFGPSCDCVGTVSSASMRPSRVAAKPPIDVPPRSIPANQSLTCLPPPTGLRGRCARRPRIAGLRNDRRRT